MVEGSWLEVPVVRVGDVPSYLPTPDAYVTVTNDGEPLLRVDVYEVAYYPFRDALVWAGWVVIGFGSRVYLVRPDGTQVRTIDLSGYYGHLYPLEDRLLIASEYGLFGVTSDGDLAWSLSGLAMDGVIVERVENGIVYCQGEWDPPDGWQPFQVSLTTGAVMTAPREV